MLLQAGPKDRCHKASDDDEGKPMVELARDAAGIVAVVVVDLGGALERGMAYEGSVVSVFKADDGYC